MGLPFPCLLLGGAALPLPSFSGVAFFPLLSRAVAFLLLPLLGGVLGGATFPLSSVGRCCLAYSFFGIRTTLKRR